MITSRDTKHQPCFSPARISYESKLTDCSQPSSARSLYCDYRELKHQTFLIHERHGWPRRTGSGTRFACQMQIIKQNNVKPSRTPTKMPFKDLSEVLFSSYEENMISDEKLLLLCDEYSSKNPEFEPLVST